MAKSTVPVRRCLANRAGCFDRAVEGTGDRFRELAMRGAVRETEARIEWMSEMLDRFRSDALWDDRPL